MQLSDELKKAITKLDDAEKDKLLFRLLKKDQDLCSRLYFELVEQGESLQERREEIEKEIKNMVQYAPYSPGYLMMDMRSLSGSISRHVKHTRDKEGEIQLNLLMLRLYLETYSDFILENLHRARNLQEYVAKRAKTILDKLSKFHEDLYVEYEADVNFILEILHHRIAPHQAKEHNLPLKWPS